MAVGLEPWEGRRESFAARITHSARSRLGWASCGLMKTRAGFISVLTDFSHNHVGPIHPLTETQATLNKWCPSLHILLHNIH